MLDLSRLEAVAMHEEPFRWAYIGQLFAAGDAAQLAASFPRDHYMTIPVGDAGRPYSYESRAFIKLGRQSVSYPGALMPAWHRLGQSLLSPAYRQAMSCLTGLDLAIAPMEVNLYQYGPQAWLKPHCDIDTKIVTHVLYFNERWKRSDGGCLQILTGPDQASSVAEVTPIVGSSAVILRGVHSWHAISPVRPTCTRSRRSMNIIFYVPGFAETMWPFDGEAACLHNYQEPSPTGLVTWIRARLFG